MLQMVNGHLNDLILLDFHPLFAPDLPKKGENATWIPIGFTDKFYIFNIFSQKEKKLCL